jgi:hypothetical protein
VGREVVATQSVPKGKGSIISLSRAALLEHYGEEGLERAIAACTTESQAILRGDIAPDELYPEAVIAEFVAALYEITGPEAFARLTREFAKQQVNTVLRFLIHVFASPKQLSRNNHKLWNALHDTGKLEVVHSADNRSHIINLSGFTFPTIEYEKAFVEYHCGILELTGAKNARGISEQVGPERYRQWFVWE